MREKRTKSERTKSQRTKSERKKSKVESRIEREKKSKEPQIEKVDHRPLSMPHITILFEKLLFRPQENQQVQYPKTKEPRNMTGGDAQDYIYKNPHSSHSCPQLHVPPRKKGSVHALACSPPNFHLVPKGCYKNTINPCTSDARQKSPTALFIVRGHVQYPTCR